MDLGEWVWNIVNLIMCLLTPTTAAVLDVGFLLEQNDTTLGTYYTTIGVANAFSTTLSYKGSKKGFSFTWQETQYTFIVSSLRLH